MQKKPNRLLETRKRLGLKQREIADMLDVSPNYIYLVESGRKPMTTQLDLLLDGLESRRGEPNSNDPTGIVFDGVKEEVPPYAHDARMLDQAHPPPWHCPDCAKKNLEIDQLKRIVENLSSALAKNNN